MQQILASFSVSVSELKEDPATLINEAGEDTIVILDNNLPTAYLISANKYEILMNRLEDYELGKIIEDRQSEKYLAIEVMLDDL
jgi:antitoxin StbD